MFEPIFARKVKHFERFHFVAALELHHRNHFLKLSALFPAAQAAH